MWESHSWTFSRMVISFQMFEIYKILVAEFGLIGRGTARVGQVPDERDRKKERNRKKKD